MVGQTNNNNNNNNNLNFSIYLQSSLTIHLVCYIYPVFCVYHLPHFMFYSLYEYTSFSISSSSSNLPVKSIYLFSLVYFKMKLPCFIHLSIYLLYLYLILFVYPVFRVYHLLHFMVYPFYKCTSFSISSSSSNLSVKSIYIFP